MKLLERLKVYEEDNKYVEEMFSHIKKSEKVYIFGAGDRAQWLGKKFNEAGIEFCGFLVNQRYYNPDFKIGMYGYEKSVWCYEDILDKESGITIILGIPQCMLNLEMFHNTRVKKLIPINIGNRDDYLMEYKKLLEHEQELEELYEMLEDEYSRECLFYCLRGRLTGKDFEFIPSKWSDPQYFLDDIVEWSNKECVVDCGAFDGDTVAEFLCKKPASDMFQYKVYAWEPDEKNYKILKEKYKDNERIITVPKATYSKKGQLGFTAEGGEMSMLSNAVENVVETDTIDAVLESEKATFIKMDVEGSELEALVGAKVQIINNKPRLAICIYHKQEDFWTIPKYIKELNKDYKFYIKTHSSMPTELVLFCV